MFEDDLEKEGVCMVTVIVPIYNVENYLDQCIGSIVNQTYTNLEILLLDDGSTDHSLEKCIQWKEKDSRIQVIHKENEGQGPTRNYGIRIARGEFVIFVDSDDWLANNYIETLYEQIIQSDSDMAACNCKSIWMLTGVEVEDLSGYRCAVLNKQGIIRFGIPSPNCRIFRKELLDRIVMPAIPYEDLAVFSSIVIESKSISGVNQGLYYYRCDREGSTTNRESSLKYYVDALRISYEYMNTHHLIGEYYSAMRDQAVFHLASGLRVCKQKYAKSYEGLKKEFRNFLDKYYPDWNNRFKKRYVIFGSYMLSKMLDDILKSVPEDFLGIDEQNHYYVSKYNFSTVVATMFHHEECDSVKHTNPYREKMLNAELKNELLKELEESYADYVLLDFLEDRYGLIETKVGLVTDSELIHEVDSPFEVVDYIGIEDDRYQGLWEDSCLKLIQILREKYQPEQVILVENYLAESFGDYNMTREYKEVEQIRKINRQIEAHYSFFKKNAPEYIVIQADERNNCFTDQKFRHGVHPWHYNYEYQIIIENKILDYL